MANPELRIDDQNLLDGFAALLDAVEDTRPAMREIAAILADRAEESFDKEQSPSGVPWAFHSEVTQRLRAAIGRGSGKKLKVTGQLAASVQSESGQDFARVGTNKVYAAMHQFGGVTSPKSMIPGKGIPARPFLGVNKDDTKEIIDMINDHILRHS